MIGLSKYISDLKAKSADHLSREYHIDRFSLTEFELLNLFLLDQAIDKRWNLFVKTVKKDDQSETYLPTIISVAISLFFKNYCESDSFYKVGDILQKKGVRYEIMDIADNQYTLKYIYRGIDTTLQTTKSILDKDYLITNATFKDRKVKTKLIDYRNFFKEIFNTDNFPSAFPKKAIIIIEKKDFLNEIKAQTFSPKIKLDKAIPFQWINKNGKFEAAPIPIDPMIYLVPDYETFKEYIFNAGIDVDVVVVIGKNKYQPDILRKIKRDLREEEIPSAIIIGSEPIEDDYQVFKKWNWTIPEIAHLHTSDQASTLVISVPKDEFQNQIEAFDNYIKKVNEKYYIRLSSFGGFKKLLYSLVLPSDNSRLKNQIDYLKFAITKRYTEEIDTALFNQGLDPKNEIAQLSDHVQTLLSRYSNTKRFLLDQLELDFVVIPSTPKDAAEIWKEEYRCKTLSYKEFLNKLKNVTTRKTFLFLSPFGYKLPQELFEFIRTTFHSYLFLSYEEEGQVIRHLERKYENSLAGELNSDDRKSLSGIVFPYTKQPEEVLDLIDRISEKHAEESNRSYPYEDASSVNYEIDFENGDILILEGNKSVLLESNGQMKRIKVSSLVSGDRVRIYSNLTKELLFETAKKQDTNGRLSEIEGHSRYWKKCLNDHFKKNVHLHSEEDLLKILQQDGISITSPITLKNWLNLESPVKFPQKERDLLVIKKNIGNHELDKKIPDILKSRKVFNGIMIALGRDLSDEVMEYITNKNKGQILTSFPNSEIQSLASTSAPLRTVRTIQITEEDEPE